MKTERQTKNVYQARQGRRPTVISRCICNKDAVNICILRGNGME
jgi:hypothetical protein